MRATLGWEPQVSLEQGLAHTYAWISDQIRQRSQRPAPAAERV
jgi:nucleoside-diphosphate-sugar epimerase